MRGTHSSTGKAIEGIEHLRQSIADILTTPIGSRVMRRDYGSRLFELIASPVTPDRLIEFYAAVADALNKWEPRVRITSVSLSSITAGRPVFSLVGKVAATGSNFSTTVAL